MLKRSIASLVTSRYFCIRSTSFCWPLLHLISINRNYSDIKTNVELLFRNIESPTIPSVLKIKRAIRNQINHELNDGFSCIRTKCPACTLPTESTSVVRVDPKDQKNIYINKCTGE